MRILHTSDWHLGHTLHDVSREYEHRTFLAWLVAQLQERQIDALLIAGDIFDTANPSAASQDLWFWFLAQAIQARPGLQIVAIAGNHDSAARLQAPDHLLRHFEIRVVGSLPRTPEGALDAGSLLVTLRNAEGVSRTTVVAMPFLRAGDLPAYGGAPSDSPDHSDEDSLALGVQSLYQAAFEAARARKLPILAMGHCYLASGQVSELSERKVLGGNQHALSISLFPEDIAYVALGHLHLPQAMDHGRIRYSGSPLPLSMAERHYPHAVTQLEIQDNGVIQQEQVRTPRVVDLLRIPEREALPLSELLIQLAALISRLPEDRNSPPPFLEVCVRLEKPEATLRTTLESALEGKGYNLAKITPQYTGTGQALGDLPQANGLQDLAVEEVFRRKWARDFNGAPSAMHLSAFHELVEQVNQAAAPQAF